MSWGHPGTKVLPFHLCDVNNTWHKGRHTPKRTDGLDIVVSRSSLRMFVIILNQNMPVTTHALMIGQPDIHVPNP